MISRKSLHVSWTCFGFFEENVRVFREIVSQSPVKLNPVLGSLEFVDLEQGLDVKICIF